MIIRTDIYDARYQLENGAGSDAIHRDPQYAYATVHLKDDGGNTGVGLAFTLGEGNDLVCKAAEFYARQFLMKDIEELMHEFGCTFNKLSNEQQFRWLGPHKGVVHLGLCAATNACYDLWAKNRGLPLWKLLISLSPEEIVQTLDLSYLEDVLTCDEAIALLQEQATTKEERMNVIENGYPGYDTSVGWFNYDDEKVKENCRRAIGEGFKALKLKVGSDDPARDIRRANIVRNIAGDDIKVMLDANQQWNLPQAISVCTELKEMNPYWIEEPTHPDDILAHQTLANKIAPVKLALGEHVANRIAFKNYLQTGCAGFIQVDAVRVGGVSEFITISLLAKKFGVPVVPHVGDMGQLHQHLVLFNHIAIGHPALFLEHIPHLKKHFVHPVKIDNGVYVTPMEPGSSCDLKPII